MPRVGGTHPRRGRLLSAAPLASVLVGGGVTSAVVFLGWLPDRGSVLLFAGAQVCFDGCATALAYRLADRARTRSLRRFWRGILVAWVVYTLGDLTQAVIAAADPDPTASFTAGVGEPVMLAAQVVVLVTMLVYPLDSAADRARTRFWLDTGIVVVGTAFSAWSLLSADLLGRPGGTAQAVALTILLTIDAFVVAKLVLNSRPPVTRSAFAVCLAAIVLITAPATAVGPGTHGHDLRVALVLRLLSTVAMTASFMIELINREGRAGPAPRRRRPHSVLPYAPVTAMAVVTVAVLPDGLGVRAQSALVGWIVVTALVTLRQLLAFADNTALAGRLDASLAELGRHERWLRALLRHSSDITVVIGSDRRLTYVSPAVERVLGVPAEELLDRSWVGWVHPDDRAGFEAARVRLRDLPGSSVTVQGRLRHADGGWRWLEIICTDRYADPTIRGTVCNAREVTETRQLHDRLRYRASHDDLTGLANRALFAERLDAAVADSGQPVGVLLIDLDEFKSINDDLGHHTGDAVLTAVAERLGDCVRDVDTAARLGGDEFAVVLPGATREQAARIADRFLDRLTEPVRTDRHEVLVRASVGIAAGSDLGDGAALLRMADAEMYRMKTAGRYPAR